MRHEVPVVQDAMRDGPVLVAVAELLAEEPVQEAARQEVLHEHGRAERRAAAEAPVFLQPQLLLLGTACQSAARVLLQAAPAEGSAASPPSARLLLLLLLADGTVLLLLLLRVLRVLLRGLLRGLREGCKDV